MFASGHLRVNPVRLHVGPSIRHGYAQDHVSGSQSRQSGDKSSPSHGCKAVRYVPERPGFRQSHRGQNPAPALVVPAPGLDVFDDPFARRVLVVKAQLHQPVDALVGHRQYLAHGVLADPELVAKTTGAPMGFAGPVGLGLRIFADNSIRGMMNFVTGGNKRDIHYLNVNIGRDFTVEAWGDLRVITPSDPCPRCGSEIRFGKGIEVGHVFKLGTKYSRAMNALFLDENGREQPMVMGCYGIGVSRLIAAVIEKNHDEKGIIWPQAVAPFDAEIVVLEPGQKELMQLALECAGQLQSGGREVLIDDRDESAGRKFNDADLIGLPWRVILGRRTIKEGTVEIKNRRTSQETAVEKHLAGAHLLKVLASQKEV